MKENVGLENLFEFGSIVFIMQKKSTSHSLLTNGKPPL